MQSFLDILGIIFAGSFIWFFVVFCEVALFIGWLWLIAKVLKFIFKPSLRRRKKALRNKIIDADFEEIHSDEISKKQ